MEKVASKEEIREALMLNKTYSGPCGSLSRELSAKERAIIINLISSKLDKCKHNLGEKFAKRLWAKMKTQIALRTNWLAPCGIWPLVNTMYSKNSRLVQTELKLEPVEIKDAIKEAMTKAGADEDFS